jgi:hypothetical protein
MNDLAGFGADEDVPRAQLALLFKQFSNPAGAREPSRAAYPLAGVVFLRPAPPSFHAAISTRSPHRASILSSFRERSRSSIEASRVSGGRARRHSASDSVLVFQGTPPARDEDIVRPASASVHRAEEGQLDGAGPALKGPASGANGERAWRHATQLALVSLKPHCGRRRFRASPGTCWGRIVPALALWHPAERIWCDR